MTSPRPCIFFSEVWAAFPTPSPSSNNMLVLRWWSKIIAPTTHLAASFLKSLKGLGHTHSPSQRARNWCNGHQRLKTSPRLPSSGQGRNKGTTPSPDSGISSFPFSVLPSFDPPGVQRRLSPLEFASPASPAPTSRPIWLLKASVSLLDSQVRKNYCKRNS